MRRPRISIGLPVYNGGEFIVEAIDSLLNQTYGDFELIISDNASTDATAAICHDYAAKDRRIRYYRNRENIGAARNFNRVFELSTGEYFKWATADDVCKPELLARCLPVLDSDPNVVLTCAKTGFINETGSLLERKDPGWDLRSDLAHERLRLVLYAGHMVNAYYGLVRSSALARTRLIAGYPGGDYRILGELSLLGKFVEIPENLFLRRLHPGASSHNAIKNQIANLEWQVRFYTGQSGLSLPRLHIGYDHLTTIIQSELRLAQKLSLVGSLLRSLWWQKVAIWDEIHLGFKSYMHKLISSTSNY